MAGQRCKQCGGNGFLGGMTRDEECPRCLGDGREPPSAGPWPPVSEEQLTTAKPPNRSPAEAAAARELLGSLMVDWLTDRHKIYCYFAERGDLMAGVGPGFFLYMFGPGGGHVHIPISDDDDDAHRLARVLWVLDAYGIRLPGSRIPAFR